MEDKNKKYDFYFVNSREDAPYIYQLSLILQENGYSSFYSGSNIDSADTFFGSMINAIRDAKAVILFMTPNFITSPACYKETYIALENAENYDKLVIPVVDKNITKELKDKYLPQVINKYQSIYMKLDKESIDISARNIIKHYEMFLKKYLLYEQFNEYCQIQYDEGIVKTSSEIFKILIKQTPKLKIDSDDDNASSYIELIEFLSRLYSNLNLSYSLEDKKLMDYVGAMLQPLKDLLDYKTFYEKVRGYKLSLLKVAIALHILSLTLDLRIEVVDVKTNGDVHIQISEDEMHLRSILKEQYDYLYEVVGFNKEEYKEKELGIINGIHKLSIFGWIKESREEKKARDPAELFEKEEDNILHDQLLAIAKYIDKSNELFESISSDDVTFEFLSCLKTSYERLKNYSETANCKDIVAHCIGKLAIINQKLEGLSENPDNEGLKEGCFKALLGLSQPETGTYDVFISYSHKDDDLAASIYRFIKSNFLTAFYDKVTLPQLGKSEYHDAIMNAIDNSNNFIIVLSDLSHLESHWVDLEMKTFNTELTEGRKDGNFIFIVTDDVFDKIISSNKKCLPIQYRGYEIMRTRDYKERLITYLKH